MRATVLPTPQLQAQYSSLQTISTSLLYMHGDGDAGRLVVAESVIDPAHEQRWSEYVSKHRCDSQSRGSVYDSRAGAGYQSKT